MDRSETLARQLAHMGIPLAAEKFEPLLWFLDELRRWNRRVNLTAITDPVEGVEKHLADSLTLCPLLDGRERMLDLGSGGGFPGIPLKIAMPGLQVVSVDAVQKKIAFQRHAARHLGFGDFQALHLRAEQLPEMEGYAGSFDVIVSRAFTSLSAFVALALPCLAPGGRVIAMKGAEGERELQDAQKDLERMGVVCSEVRRLHLPVTGAVRTLIVLRRTQGV